MFWQTERAVATELMAVLAQATLAPPMGSDMQVLIHQLPILAWMRLLSRGFYHVSERCNGI